MRKSTCEHKRDRNERSAYEARKWLEQGREPAK